MLTSVGHAHAERVRRTMQSSVPFDAQSTSCSYNFHGRDSSSSEVVRKAIAFIPLEYRKLKT